MSLLNFENPYIQDFAECFGPLGPDEAGLYQPLDMSPDDARLAIVYMRDLTSTLGTWLRACARRQLILHSLTIGCFFVHTDVVTLGGNDFVMAAGPKRWQLLMPRAQLELENRDLVLAAPAAPISSQAETLRFEERLRYDRPVNYLNVQDTGDRSLLTEPLTSTVWEVVTWGASFCLRRLAFDGRSHYHYLTVTSRYLDVTEMPVHATLFNRAELPYLAVLTASEVRYGFVVQSMADSNAFMMPGRRRKGIVRVHLKSTSNREVFLSCEPLDGSGAYG